MAGEEKTVVQHTEVAGSNALHFEKPEAPSVDPATDGMPDGGDVKFWNKDEKAYNWEAHAKEQAFKLEQLSKKQQPAGSPPPADEAPPAEGTPEEVAKAAGVNLEAANRAILENGKVDDDTRAKLKAVGIDDATLDEYARFVKGSVDAHVAQVTEALGGDLNKVITWAKSNYSEAEIAAINELLNDPVKWKLGVTQVRTDMGMLPAPQGQMLRGANQTATPGKGGLEPITDADLQAAIMDTRWKTDRKFRETVYARAKASGLSHTAASGRSHTGGM